MRWTPACVEATRHATKHHFQIQAKMVEELWEGETLECLLYACAHLRWHATGHQRLVWEQWIERTLKEGRGAGRRD